MIVDQNQELKAKWHEEDAQFYPVPERMMGLAATSTINPYSKFALVRDLSHWDRDRVKSIEDLRGYDALVVKIGGSENDPRSEMGNPYEDDLAAKYIQWGWELNVPVAVYWFVGPRAYLEGEITKSRLYNQADADDVVLQTQIKALRAGKSWKGVCKIYDDVEDASLWIYNPYKVSTAWIGFYLDNLRDRRLRLMKTNEYPKLGLGVYSRKSFVEQIDPPNFELGTWLNNHPDVSNWCASYPRQLPVGVTPKEIREKWLPLATWKPRNFSENTWEMWQFAGLPFDVNLYNGTPEQLREAWGYKDHSGIVVPPPVDEDPTEEFSEISLEECLKYLKAVSDKLNGIATDVTYIRSNLK